MVTALVGRSPHAAERRSVRRLRVLLERFSSHLGRTLYATSTAGFAVLEGSLDLPPRHFVALLAADFSSASDRELFVAAGTLLERGASYVVCWGPDCERAHDIIDESAVQDITVFCGATIMTTWHSDEPLDDAILFFLNSTTPDGPYEESTNSAVAISIGDNQADSAIRQALSDPDAFISRVCSQPAV